MTAIAEQARAVVADVDAERPRITKALPSLVDIGLTAAPLTRQQLAETRRRGTEALAAWASGRAAVLKALAAAEAAGQQHANVVWAIAEQERRAEAGPERERPHWATGARYLRDGKGHETPGAITALARERGWHSLPTLPTCAARLAAAEADLQRAVDQLRHQLDSWRRKAAAPQATVA
jgi:hypothetical protein